MAAYYAFRRVDGRLGIPLLATGLLLLAGSFLAGLVDPRIAEAQRVPLRLIVLILPFSLILLGAALGEAHHKWTYPRPLLLLGDASYSVYLVHSAVISVLAPLAGRLGLGTLPPLLLYLLVSSLAIAVGTGAHLAVERPLLGRIRHARWRRKGTFALQRGEEAA